MQQFEGRCLVAPAGAPAPRRRLDPRYAPSGEAFADRGYRPDGSLVARGEPGDLITDPEQAAEQAMSIAAGRRVLASDGTG